MKPYLYTLIALLCVVTYSQAQTWHSLGSGLNGPVYDIVIDGGDVYVGGHFTDAGGKEDADYIARWDGLEWHAVAPGLNNAVHAIVIDGKDFYIGGDFTEPHYWLVRLVNGEWSDMWGMDGPGPVKAMAKGQPGFFAATTTGAKFYGWDGFYWSVWGHGFKGEVNDIVIRGNEVFIGGSFSIPGEEGNFDRIGHLKNYEWQPIEQPAEISNVYDLALHGTELYLAGEPLTLCEGGMGGIHEPILRWSGNAYYRLDRLGGCRKVTTLGVFGDHLLVDAYDVLSEESVFKWNLGSYNWDGFLTYFVEGPDYIEAFASDGANLYMGGSFTNFEGEDGDHIIRWEDPFLSATEEDNNTFASLQVFPNPAEDIIQFELEDCHSGSHLVTMIDATGSTVLKKETKDCTLDISSLDAGIYFLKVENGGNSSVGKIIKQ